MLLENVPPAHVVSQLPSAYHVQYSKVSCFGVVGPTPPYVQSRTMGYCLKIDDSPPQHFCQSQSFKVMLFFDEFEIWISFWSLYLEIVRIM